MNDDIKTIVYGSISPDTIGYGNNDMMRRVFDPLGVAPTIRSSGGGNTEPKIVVPDIPRILCIGNLYGTKVEPNPQGGRVYNPRGISPSLGHRANGMQPFICKRK